ncbi:MFS transporter [Methylobrevis pamukkalensis]|nr:MFS transporter [Methylobrevis pamukkalensis]
MDLRTPAARTLPQSAAAPVGIGMDVLPLTALHLVVVVIAAFGFAFDMMEVALGNVLSAVFSAPPYSVAPGELSLLLSAMYVGAIPGALSAGWFADRFGRRTVLVAVLLLLATTSIAAAASRGIEELIVARMASGLALGAYPPLIIAFLTDLMPARRRGLLIMTVSGLAATGPMAMIFLVRWLTPIEPLGIEAWRWAFLLGSAGSLVVAIAFFYLPESPRWLSAKGRAAEAEAALARFRHARPIGAAECPLPAASGASPERIEDTPFDWPRFSRLGFIYFAAPWATVAFPVLMGAVLIERGFKLSDSLFYVASRWPARSSPAFSPASTSIGSSGARR